MLHIILTILKIIGILIVVILALLLVITGVVLFVPIRYRVNGKKDEESFLVKAEVYWLLHLFRMKAVYPEPGRSVAKVLWFTVYDSDKEDKPKKTNKKKAKKEKKKKQKRNLNENQKKSQPESKGNKTTEGRKATVSEEQKQIEEAVQNGIKEENKKAAQRKKEDYEQKIKTVTENEQTETENGNGTELEPEKGTIRQLIDKIKAIIQKIFDILKNIRYTIRRFCDKIKEIWANIQYYIEVFNEEVTKRAFSMCKQQLYKIWKNIRPQKFMAELKIGTGEPDTTGYILAVHGMLYPLIGNNIVIEPDFENQVVEGTFFIKGRITLVVLVCAAIKLYFDEDIRHFLKRFKREE